jgi:hypothetical protein
VNLTYLQYGVSQICPAADQRVDDKSCHHREMMVRGARHDPLELGCSGVVWMVALDEPHHFDNVSFQSLVVGVGVAADILRTTRETALG